MNMSYASVERFDEYVDATDTRLGKIELANAQILEKLERLSLHAEEVTVQDKGFTDGIHAHDKRSDAPGPRRNPFLATGDDKAEVRRGTS